VSYNTVAQVIALNGHDVTMQVHVDSARPATLAQQIREQVTWAISSGTLEAGDALPPVREMARRLGVNLHTVRAAYRMLAADGLVEVRRGTRTRVAAFDPRRLWPEESAARSHLVGLVLPTLANPFYAELVEGAQEAALRSGTLLIVSTTHDDQARALRSIAQLAARGVDGVIAVSTEISQLLAGPGGDMTGERRLPLVVVDRPGVPGHGVEVDLEQVGYLATRHLVEHGHRVIGLVSIDGTASNVLPREIGYRRALAEAGLPVQDELVARVDAWEPAAGDDGATRLLAAANRPTALVAISDLLAIGAMRAARRLGLRIPDDVALVGVDDIPHLDVVDPPLSSVALPARAMGAEAMTTLDRIWAGEARTPRRVVLQARLVIRESCGQHASR
jgi:DNA-binding LacI/PurR family transcriptional regulator